MCSPGLLVSSLAGTVIHGAPPHSRNKPGAGPAVPFCDAELDQQQVRLGHVWTAQSFINPAALSALLITASRSGSGGTGACCHPLLSSLSSTSPSSTGSEG